MKKCQQKYSLVNAESTSNLDVYVLNMNLSVLCNLILYNNITNF